MLFYLRRSVRLALPVLVVAGVLGPACSSDGGDDDAVGPGEGGSSGSAAQGDAGAGSVDGSAGASSAAAGADGAGASAGAGGDASSLTPADEQALELDEEGGTLEAGYATLIVPPGALAEPTTITLRRLSSSAGVLDDVYEMLPSGLEFLEPATFVLSVGVENANPEGDPRVLSYVDGSVPTPLPSAVGIPTEGAFAGAVLHFSEVAAVVPGAATASPHFGGFDFGLPYSVRGGCGDLASEFRNGLPTSGGNPEGLASETSVECSTTSVKWKLEPSVNGKTCATLSVPPSVRQPQAQVYYPSWDDRPSRCDDAWDDFLSRLAEHEKQHLDVGTNGCAAAFDEVNTKTGCGKDLAAAQNKALQAFMVDLTRALASTRTAQAALDMGTDHGVTMDCDCECEDPCEHFDQAQNKCVPIECTGECEQCVNGECQVGDCGECVPKSATDCPEGSTWDSSTKTCIIGCTSGGSIAGLPCVYSGTASTTLTGAGVTWSADVTLQAKGFDGCLVLYELTGGTSTVSPPSPECLYDPDTHPVDPELCRFVIMPGADPYLIADCGSMFDTTLRCDQQSVATTVSGVWLYTINQPVEAGEPISGTYSGVGMDVTFDFTPQ